MSVIGCGMAFPSSVRVAVTDSVAGANEHAPLVEISLELEAKYLSSLGRYGVAGMKLFTCGEEGEITGTILRALPIQEYLRSGLEQLGFYSLHEAHVSSQTALSWIPDDVESITSRGPGKQELEQVAQLYRIAEVLNQRPAKHVADVLRTPYATASKWITKARNVGAFEDLERAVEMLQKTSKLNALELQLVHSGAESK